MKNQTLSTFWNSSLQLINSFNSGSTYSERWYESVDSTIIYVLLSNKQDVIKKQEIVFALPTTKNYIRLSKQIYFNTKIIKPVREILPERENIGAGSKQVL